MAGRSAKLGRDVQGGRHDNRKPGRYVRNRMDESTTASKRTTRATKERAADKTMLSNATQCAGKACHARSTSLLKHRERRNTVSTRLISRLAQPHSVVITRLQRVVSRETAASRPTRHSTPPGGTDNRLTETANKRLEKTPAALSRRRISDNAWLPRRTCLVGTISLADPQHACNDATSPGGTCCTSARPVRDIHCHRQ